MARPPRPAASRGAAVDAAVALERATALETLMLQSLADVDRRLGEAARQLTEVERKLDVAIAQMNTIVVQMQAMAGEAQRANAAAARAEAAADLALSRVSGWKFMAMGGGAVVGAIIAVGAWIIDHWTMLFNNR